MDFALSEQEQALRDLADQIIGDNVSHTSMRALEQQGEHLDRETWKKLADAGVINAVLPESVGGSGLGAVALGALLQVVGEHAAPLPVLSGVAMAAVPIARFATSDFHRELLSAFMAGESLIACAPNAMIEATRSGDTWTLNGSASFVLDGLDADHLLAPTSAGWTVIDLTPEAGKADAAGVTRRPMATTSRRPVTDITFGNVTVTADRHLGSPAEETRDFIAQHTDCAIASYTAGLCAGAIKLMADHAQQRHQFDRPIASFQAVSQRAGDAYIDNLAVELTAQQAAWRLDAGLDAEREIAIARWWAAEGGYRIIHAASHIHGGIGVDYDYPLHRYVLLARQLELTHGTSEQQLEKLGNSIDRP